MKVTGVRHFVCDGGEASFVFVIVDTDEGISGYGECTLEGRELAVVGAIEECARMLVGKNPLEVEKIWTTWNRSFPWKGVVVFSAMSGLEHALWDIAGKFYGLPVHKMLGGPVRDRVRAYTWPGASDDPAEVGRLAKAAADQWGFSAFKIDTFREATWTVPQRELEHMENCILAIRDAVGPYAEIAVDGHWRFIAPAAVQIARVLEPLNVLFLEEPTTSDNAEGLTRLRSTTRIPLATGERHYTRWDVWPLLRDRLVDVIQTDLCHAGGILEVRKIAAMAEACDVLMAPHNPNGPVSLAAVVQVAACTPNFLITEYVHSRETIAHRYVKEPLKVVDGHVAIPDRPGIGVELDEDALKEYPAGVREVWTPSKIVVGL